MILVTSAGNSGNTADPYIATPGDAKNILTIGAVDEYEVLASFSSIGPSFDNRIKPELAAQGVFSVFSNENGEIVGGNGTSFSSPILCGAIASFWSAYPNLSALEVMQKVKESADQYLQPDNFKGYGIPDFNFLLNEVLIDEVQFTLFPNPINDQLNITKNNNLLANFEMYDIVGRQVAKTKFSNTNYTFSTSALASGTYIYYLEVNNTVKSGKIIKK